jgi:hypothetical protein
MDEGFGVFQKVQAVLESITMIPHNFTTGEGTYST